jgi:S-DNA-T family DNA segregation ATPase FtsK/SpoIIIE
VDPKVVEMAPFKDIPHLMCPVINDAARAASVLEWACGKMDERYEFLAEAGVRNIKGYNSLTTEELIERFKPTTPEEEAKIPKKLPYIVIIIDELADLMMTSGKEVETYIVRLAQKARAVGIHLILATQRPQATVVTGLIKSNMPSKIAFRVASKMDSRIVLDQNGADLLLGQGDMLFLPPGASKPIRSQGTFIDDKEIRESVKIVKNLADAQYEPELVQIKSNLGGDSADMEKDELFDDAVRVVLETKRGSVSLLQRRLTIGYSRASRLIEQMAAAGIVGEYKGSQAREAQITLEEWEAMKAAEQTDADSGMTV